MNDLSLIITLAFGIPCCAVLILAALAIIGPRRK